MITHPGNFRIFLATQPVDFRKGMDGLSAIIANDFDLDPFCGAIYVFRSRRADRLKLIVWDGTGLVMVMKRLERKRFIWPMQQSGPISLTKIQFDALFEGINWQKVVPSRTHKPVFL